MNSIKMEKANAILKYQSLPKIIKLFRFMEIAVFVCMISNFSSVGVSGDYFRGITFSVVLSPKFVFVIGNLIVLIIFLQSRAYENSDGNENTDLCYEYVKSCVVSTRSSSTITVTRTSTSTSTPADVTVAGSKRKICRSKSENPMKTGCRDNQRELRRSVTELSRSKNVKDKLGGDEFRRTVEAFIARQQKMLRDEEFSPMVYIG